MRDLTVLAALGVISLVAGPLRRPWLATWSMAAAVATLHFHFHHHYPERYSTSSETWHAIFALHFAIASGTAIELFARLGPRLRLARYLAPLFLLSTAIGGSASLLQLPRTSVIYLVTHCIVTWMNGISHWLLRAHIWSVMLVLVVFTELKDPDASISLQAHDSAAAGLPFLGPTTMDPYYLLPVQVARLVLMASVAVFATNLAIVVPLWMTKSALAAPALFRKYAIRHRKLTPSTQVGTPGIACPAHRGRQVLHRRYLGMFGIAFAVALYFFAGERGIVFWSALKPGLFFSTAAICVLLIAGTGIWVLARWRRRQAENPEPRRLGRALVTKLRTPATSHGSNGLRVGIPMWNDGTGASGRRVPLRRRRTAVVKMPGEPDDAIRPRDSAALITEVAITTPERSASEVTALGEMITPPHEQEDCQEQWKCDPRMRVRPDDLNGFLATQNSQLEVLPLDRPAITGVAAPSSPSSTSASRQPPARMPVISRWRLPALGDVWWGSRPSTEGITSKGPVKP